jgi:CheY-like chemotaxis protein
LYQADHELVIRIKDTGIGISHDQLPYIFDEFRQADERASRKFGGTGLGLAIAKKYADMLEGRLDVESAPGIGSVFSIALPLVHSESTQPAPKEDFHKTSHRDEPGDDRLRNGGTGITLLLVEDSEPQIVQMEDILQEEGYTVQVARNGKEALEMVRNHIPDAMILDLTMPEVAGFEVLRQIRELPETSQLPVLILSAKHITKEELSFLRGNNISELIQKGDVNRSDLLMHIRNMIKPKKTAEAGPVKQRSGRMRKNRKPVVLLIEDNPDSSIAVQALLGEQYELTIAADGTDGLEKAKILEPDLILLDISLPGIDGFEVLNIIRKTDRISETAVIAVTARAMKGDREMLLEYGFDGYIAKPVISGQFEKAINAFLYGVYDE